MKADGHRIPSLPPPSSQVKPLLLLDVDGVICPMGPGCGEELLEYQGPNYPVWFSAGTPRRLQGLAEVFTLVWATKWEGEANRLLAPALGLPPLAFIRFPSSRGRPGRSHKLGAVKAFVQARPFAWLDDEVGDDMVSWAEERPTPTLIRPIDPRVGLNNGDVDALLVYLGASGGRTECQNIWPMSS